jgi:AcrR family transcriptional regulator
MRSEVKTPKGAPGTSDASDASGTPNTSARPADLCPFQRILRPLRADAQRNRAKVLVAAEQVFAEEGLAVPIDEIARRAGVGVGTVYRHFPTKEALFEAIVLAHFEALSERAEELSTATDPGQALFTFVSELVETAVKKKDLTDELGRAGVISEALLAGSKDRLAYFLDVLLERAQEAGAVRRDISRTEVTALVMGTIMACNQQGCQDATPRLVRILCDGFRAHSE